MREEDPRADNPPSRRDWKIILVLVGVAMIALGVSWVSSSQPTPSLEEERHDYTYEVRNFTVQVSNYEGEVLGAEAQLELADLVKDADVFALMNVRLVDEDQASAICLLSESRRCLFSEAVSDETSHLLVLSERVEVEVFELASNPERVLSVTPLLAELVVDGGYSFRLLLADGSSQQEQFLLESLAASLADKNLLVAGTLPVFPDGDEFVVWERLSPDAGSLVSCRGLRLLANGLLVNEFELGLVRFPSSRVGCLVGGVFVSGERWSRK